MADDEIQEYKRLPSAKSNERRLVNDYDVEIMHNFITKGVCLRCKRKGLYSIVQEAYEYPWPLSIVFKARPAIIITACHGCDWKQITPID